jgi:hypothetical protein
MRLKWLNELIKEVVYNDLKLVDEVGISNQFIYSQSNKNIQGKLIGSREHYLL